MSIEEDTNRIGSDRDNGVSSTNGVIDRRHDSMKELDHYVEKFSTAMTELRIQRAKSKGKSHVEICESLSNYYAFTQAMKKKRYTVETLFTGEEYAIFKVSW